MSEIEKEQPNFFLRGIEHIFLKFKGQDSQEVNRQPKQKKLSKEEQVLLDKKREELRYETKRKEQEERNALYEQQQQATKLLEAKLHDLYFSMIDNGYKPTKEQIKKFDYYINDLIYIIDKGDNLALINNYIKSGYRLSEDNLYDLLSMAYFQKKYFSKEFFDSNYRFTNLPQEHLLLINNLRETLFTESFAKFASEKFLNSFNDNRYFSESFRHEYPEYDLSRFPFMPHSLLNIPKFLEYFPHIILPKISSNQFINFIAKMNGNKGHIEYFLSNPNLKIDFLSRRQLNNFYEDTLHILNTVLRDYYSHDLTQMLHQTKMLHSKHYLEEQAVKKTQLAIDEYKVSSLPKNTQIIINDIQKIYNSLEIHRKALNDEQIFLIDNLFDKRIPEVLQKYFSIDPEYREIMKTSQGKNAQELMDESLNNFKSKFKEILDNINAAKLSELNVTQRYSSSI